MAIRVSDFTLPKVGGRCSAMQLREFLIDYCSCRQTLTLRRGPLSWATIGIVTSCPLNANLNTWESCLQRHRYVMALPDFAKPGSKLAKRLQLAAVKNDTWAPYLAAMSEAALDAALAPGAPRRLCDLVRDLRSSRTPLWDSSFQHGNCVEQCVASGGDDGSLGYVQTPGHVAGVSKAALAERWQSQLHIGRFYCQHGLILFSAGGRSTVLKRKKVQDVQSSVCLGDGALRLLSLLRTEAGGPPEVRWCPANVDWITRALLSERELSARMAERRFAKRPELIPICLRRKRSQGVFQYENIPETFGDMLCESAQLLRALAAPGAAKHRNTPWPAGHKRWPAADVTPQSASKRRKNV